MSDASNALLAKPITTASKGAGAGNGDRRFHNILGVNVWATTADQAVAELEQVIATNQHRKISFLNAHGANIAYGDSGYQQTLTEFLVLSDGIGLDLGARLLYGAAFPENLNGTDFVPALFSKMKGGRKIALLGARPGIADLAADRFAKDHPNLEFVVINDGYFDQTREAEILDELKSLRPDILLVALGNPHQENWIVRHCTGEHAAVCIGVGALFDFTSGSVPRAPAAMIRWRLEWLYRLWLEPGRMWRRYVLGNPMFIARILKQKFFRHGREQG